MANESERRGAYGDLKSKGGLLTPLSRFTYCGIKGDCNCGLIKVCTDPSCKCNRWKFCIVPNCTCSTPKACPDPDCKCNLLKVKL